MSYNIKQLYGGSGHKRVNSMIFTYLPNTALHCRYLQLLLKLSYVRMWLCTVLRIYLVELRMYVMINCESSYVVIKLCGQYNNNNNVIAVTVRILSIITICGLGYITVPMMLCATVYCNGLSSSHH